MAYGQGAVVVGIDPFGRGSRRPYLLVSNENHPFHGQEYVATVVTTTPRDEAVPLSEFTEGGLPKESYASPWALVTLKNRYLTKRVASVPDETLGAVVRSAMSYLEPRG